MRQSELGHEEGDSEIVVQGMVEIFDSLSFSRGIGVENASVIEHVEASEPSHGPSRWEPAFLPPLQGRRRTSVNPPRKAAAKLEHGHLSHEWCDFWPE